MALLPDLSTNPALGLFAPDELLAHYASWLDEVGAVGGADAHARSGAAPVYLDSGPSEAGAHELEVFVTCPRKYGYIYGMGGARKTGGAGAPPQRFIVPLILGTMTHILMAHWSAKIAARQARGFRYVWTVKDPTETEPPEYAERVVTDPEEILDPVHAASIYAGQIITAGISPDPWKVAHLLSRAFVAWEAWVAYETPKLAGWEIVGVETPYVVEVPLKGGRKRRTSVRVDRTMQQVVSRKVVFDDHKTAAAPDGPMVAYYQISGQVSLLRALGRTLFGGTFGGVHLNIIDVSGKKKMQRVAALPAPALDRYAGLRVIEIGQEIARLRASGVPPHLWRTAQSYTACSGREPCEFWQRCCFGEEAWQRILAQKSARAS